MRYRTTPSAVEGRRDVIVRYRTTPSAVEGLANICSRRKRTTVETFWVYMVLCSDASYYVGITNDVDRRVAEHNEGIDVHCYTYTRRPVKVVYTGEFYHPDEAIRFEKQIKGWSRKKKAALACGDWDAIKALARCRRPSTGSGSFDTSR